MSHSAANSILSYMRMAPKHEMFGAAKHSMAGAAAAKHAALVDQVRKWVGLSFFGTVLKQARQSPFRSKIMDGGRGGEMFGQMYDQQIAQKLGRGAGAKLVDSVVNKLEAHRAYSKQSNTAGSMIARGAARHQLSNVPRIAGPMAAQMMAVTKLSTQG